MKMQGEHTACYKLTDRLITILTEEVVLYKELLSLLKDEKKVLVVRREDEVYQLARKIELVVSKARALEEVRHGLVRELVGNPLLSPQGVNLSMVIEAVEEPYKGELKELQSRLIALMDSIKEINMENSIIIRRSIENIRTAFAFLKELSSFETYQSLRKDSLGYNRWGFQVF